ncbi:MAG: hypothetical protein WKG03_00480 [Telluria sp.]
MSAQERDFAALVSALDELRATLCGIGIVGNIDGHDVIRRDSVIELVDRRRAELAVEQQMGVADAIMDKDLDVLQKLGDA